MSRYPPRDVPGLPDTRVGYPVPDIAGTRTRPKFTLLISMVMLNRLRIKVRGHFIANSGEFSIVCSLEYKNVLKELLDYIKYSHRYTLIEAFHFLHSFWKNNNINTLFYIIISPTLFFSSVLTIYFLFFKMSAFMAIII